MSNGNAANTKSTDVAGPGRTATAVSKTGQAKPAATGAQTKPKPAAAKATGAAATKAAAEKKTQKPKRPTRLSPEGARFIARFEGFRGKMYNDAAGHCTIGYGHLIHHGPIRGDEPEEFRQGITKQRALELLQQDADKAAAAVRKHVKVPLTQQQFDALVCFAFNVGNEAFRTSTLVRKLNEGDYGCVPQQLNRWCKAGGQTLQGLVTRRKCEGELFKRGVY